METYFTNLYKCVEDRDTLTKVFNCVFYKLYSYCHYIFIAHDVQKYSLLKLYT